MGMTLAILSLILGIFAVWFSYSVDRNSSGNEGGLFWIFLFFFPGIVTIISSFVSLVVLWCLPGLTRDWQIALGLSGAALGIMTPILGLFLGVIMSSLRR